MVQRFYIETLGCPKNDVDSDKLVGALLADGMATREEARTSAQAHSNLAIGTSILIIPFILNTHFDFLEFIFELGFIYFE